MKKKISLVVVLCILGVMCGCGSSLRFQVPDRAMPRYCSNPDDLPALEQASIERGYSKELIKCVHMVARGGDLESSEKSRQALMAIAMKAKEEWNRREALKRLLEEEHHGTETSEFFEQVLQEEGIEGKKIAIEYFAVRDSARVVPFLRSDNADLRYQAIKVLGHQLEGWGWSDPSLVDLFCRSLEGDMLLRDKMHVLNQLVEKAEENSCTAPAVDAFLAEYNGSRWRDLPDTTFEKTRLLLDKAGYPTPEPRLRRDRTRSRPPCRGPSCSRPEHDML